MDKAVLEAEEFLNREELENELRQALADQRDELRKTLKTRYFSKIQAGFKQLQDGFANQVRPTVTVPKKDFVPARAAQRD